MMATKGAASGSTGLSSRLANMPFMKKQQRPDGAPQQPETSTRQDAAGPGPSSIAAAAAAPVKPPPQISKSLQSMKFMQKSSNKRKYEEAIEKTEKEQEEVSISFWPGKLSSAAGTSGCLVS